MRTVKEIVTDARRGCGPFEMTALEVVRMIRSHKSDVSAAFIEEALEETMKGSSFIFGRPVILK